MLPRCSAMNCCFVYVLVELSVSSSDQFCTSDAPLPSSGRCRRFPASAVLSALRLPALACPSLLLAPQASAGVRVSAPAAMRPDDGPGSGLFTLAVPFQRSCPRARAGSPRFPGGPSRDFAPVHDPGRPVAPRRFRCCLTMKASSFNDFEAARRFITCCLRFTTGVAARRDSLPAGGLRLCRAGVEPAGSLREVSAHVILLSRAFPGAINVASTAPSR